MLLSNCILHMNRICGFFCFDNLFFMKVVCIKHRQCLHKFSAGRGTIFLEAGLFHSKLDG